MNPKFVIEPRENYFVFTFHSESENVILLSRMFRTELLCKQAIHDLISAADKPGCIEKVQGKGGEYSFVARNKKSVTLGHSPVYYSAGSRDYAVRQLEMQASIATIEMFKIKKPAPQLWSA